MFKGNVSVKQRKGFTLIFTLLLMSLLASPAMANIPMGLLAGFTKFSAWWLIPLVLAIEAVAIRLIFKLSWKSSTLASLFVNLVTAVIGFFIYPIAALSLYPALGPLIVETTGGGPEIEYKAIAIGIATIDTVIELMLLAIVIELRRLWIKGFAYFLVNILTTVILLYPIVPAPQIPSVVKAKFGLIVSGGATQFLIESAKSGFIEGVEEAIAQSADLNARTSSGDTILIASLRKRAKLLKSGSDYRKWADQQLEVAKTLVSHGADVNAEGRESVSALEISASVGDMEMVKVLIDAGADVSQEPITKIYTRAKAFGSEELVAALEKAGAKLFIQPGQREFQIANYYWKKGDVGEAIDLYRQSASLGNEAAARTLGDIYTSGNRLPRDVDEAIRWYQIAMDQGDVYSEERLNEINNEKEK